MFIRKYLVDLGILIGISEGVDGGIEIVEEADDGHGPRGVRILGTDLVEVDDPREQEGDGVISPGGDRPPVSQLVRHRRRQHGVEQPGRMRRGLRGSAVLHLDLPSFQDARFLLNCIVGYLR